MKLASIFGLQTTGQHKVPGARPRDSELDLFGLTHPGKVREENQDHFLLCTVHPQVVVHATSLPEEGRLPLRGQRLATIMLVADGVGGGRAGSTASQLATEAITEYVSSTLRSYHSARGANDDEFLESLRRAALETHEKVRTEAAKHALQKDMATTLCVGVVVWPWLYVLQVGDSRCYVCEDGKLRQVTRDQTVAQALADEGLIPKDRVAESPYSHVLASAIGAESALPEVTRVDVHKRGTVILVCSDGLTKHVSDAEIEERLRAMQNAEQVSRELCNLALERGGSDNITLVVGRALEQRRG